MDITSIIVQEDIPIKLRCAVCNKLVLNAFRLPCCDQSICEPCQSSLPQSCPVCAHTPLTADDCKPNKALRLTVKAFLRSEEKKRDKDRVDAPLQHKASPVASNPATLSFTPSAQATLLQAASPKVHASAETSEEIIADRVSSYSQGDLGEHAASGHDTSHDKVRKRNSQDIPHPSVENTDNNAPGEATQDASRAIAANQKGVAAGMDNQREEAQHNEELQGSGTNYRAKEQNWDNVMGYNQGQVYGGGVGFNSGALGFGNVNWSGGIGFNPMMQMQTGMATPGWGNYPNIMGMSGMAIDPMGMSNGMFGGYGVHGLGMNNINGMSMAMDYDGGYGTWGTQSAMGLNGNYGANTGYYPGGYNQHQAHQGQFNQMHQEQQFPDNNYQNRFPGQTFPHRKGHGYAQGPRRGIGIQNQEHRQIPVQNQDDHFHNPQAVKEDAGFHHQLPLALQAPVQFSENKEQVLSHDLLVSDQKTEAEHKNVDETVDDEIALTNRNAEETKAEGDKQGTFEVTAASQAHIPTVRDEASTPPTKTEVAPLALETAVDSPIKAERDSSVKPLQHSEAVTEPTISNTMAPPAAPASAVPKGPAARFGAASIRNGPGHEISLRGRANLRSSGRGAFEGHNGYRVRGAAHGTAGDSGYALLSSAAPQVNLNPIPSAPKGQGVVGAPTGPRAMREGLPNVGFHSRGGFAVQARGRNVISTADSSIASKARSSSSDHRKSRSRSKSPTRSRTPSHRRRHRRHHRSRSGSSTDGHDERERRRERRKRRSHKYDDDENEEDEKSKETQPRNSSRESSPRARSHRGKGKHRSSHSRRDRSREHRHHRHRSRSPRDDSSVKRDKLEGSGRSTLTLESSRQNRNESSQHRQSDRERDRSDKDPRSSSTLVGEVHDQSHRSSVRGGKGKAREFKIKEWSKQSEVGTDTERAARKDAHIDPHTLEREARNRERLIKEQQRRDLLYQERERKRSRTALELEETGDGKVVVADGDPAGGKAEGQLGHKNSRRKVKHAEGDGIVRKGRRISYKYEDEERDEARAARIEKEREGARG